MDVDFQTELFIAPELLTEIEEESQVIVHCLVEASIEENAARIWPTTFIIDNATGIKYPLLHVEGISMYPHWTFIKLGSLLHFTLIFKGLPKSCQSFDLMEVIPQEGAFSFPNIPRNRSDVYQVNFD